MKFLLLLLAVLALFLLLRNSVRRRLPPRASVSPSTPPTPPGTPQQIVRCAHCGLHLPRDEALPGRGGVFCDAAHRAAYEQQHPAA